MSNSGDFTQLKTARRRVAIAPHAFVAGTPGYLHVWVKALIAAAVTTFGADVDVVAEPPPPGDTRRAIVQTDRPDAAFRTAALQDAGPLVIVIGDAALDATFLHHVGGVPRLDLLKALTASAALIRDLPRAQALVIRQSDRNARGVVASLMTKLGWPSQGDAFEQLLAAFTGPHAESSMHRVIEWYAEARFPGTRAAFRDGGFAADKTIQAAVAPAYVMAATLRPTQIVWPRGAFFDGDRPGSSAPPWIEVAGGARILFYGPYLHLPRGRWTLTVQLAFSDDLDQTVFSIEVVGDAPLARGRVKPTRSGTFAASFAFDHDAPATPLEVRISSDYGSIFGRMALIDAAFAPSDEAET